MSAVVTCRGCRSTHTSRIGAKVGEYSGRTFQYYHCDDCSLGFVEPFFGFHVYDNAYYAGKGPDPFVDYENEYLNYRTTDRVLEFEDVARIATEFLVRYRPDSSDISWLDFGCGAGGLLKYLRDRGQLQAGTQHWSMRLTGHDVGEYANRLKTIDRFPILDLEVVRALPTGTFDVISLIEVIEHIPTPYEVIALVSRLLKPRGLLLLTTGNMDSPVARRQGLNYRYHIPEIHVSHFTPECLSRAYSRHGLEPYAVRYDGAVRFKVLKSLTQPGPRAIARAALRLPGVTRLIDAAYAVSAMPCAIKGC